MPWLRDLSCVTLLACVGFGCASTPVPIATDVSIVVGDPEAFRNRFVEIQGRVEEYDAPQGDEVRTWSFAVRDLDGALIRVYTRGRDPEDVAAADQLVQRALDDDAPVFAIGYLRTGRYDRESGGPRLDLRQVQYRDTLIKLGQRRRYDDPYYSPRFHFGFGYYHGRHYGHHYGHHYRRHRGHH